MQLAQKSDDGVKLLGALYEWLLDAVPPEDDTDHTDGETYTPSQRDNAGDLRDALIPAIAAARSQLAYDVLNQLHLKASGNRALYLKKVQFEMREAQFSRQPLSQQFYDGFERDFIADIIDTTSFAMAVHTDLLAAKYDIEHGEYSLRKFFSELSFKRIATDKQGLALEADFQRLLASELNHHSKGRYSITLESHTAESKRRDILCGKGSSFASIELKMSRRWLLKDYIEALEKQLVGQYMRSRKATTGFLVIVLQEAGRKWTNSATGKQVDFNGLLAILREKALSLEAKNRTRYLRVIGIDSTAPENFRITKKIAKKKITKKVSSSIIKKPKASKKSSAKSTKNTRPTIRGAKKKK